MLQVHVNVEVKRRFSLESTTFCEVELARARTPECGIVWEKQCRAAILGLHTFRVNCKRYTDTDTDVRKRHTQVLEGILSGLLDHSIVSHLLSLFICVSFEAAINLSVGLGSSCLLKSDLLVGSSSTAVTATAVAAVMVAAEILV
uniref:Uncharacterized protein n=1 Tax=Setaria digitata TaxID=48799 RepID=A0A915PNU0_9BILA